MIRLLIFLILTLLFGSLQSECWRSECAIEGMEVLVSVHGVGSTSAEDDRSKCRVAFVSHDDLQVPGHDFSGIDYIFTDSLSYVPFAGRRGSAHFLENISSFHLESDLDGVMQKKTELLSVLLPPGPETWSSLIQDIFNQAQLLLPDHIYIDDGSLESHAAAFAQYRFSLIADDLGNRSISQPFVHSLGFHTVALFNGFVEIGAMVFNGIGDFMIEPFDMSATIAVANKHNGVLGTLWHYQRILQDQFQYRYNRPFEERLYSQACSLCRLRASPAGAPPLAFVGIYSARANFLKRQAVRETWGKVLREVYGLRYRFFLGEASPGASSDEMLMRHELEEHNDIVFLDAAEGYRMNSRKGLLFLEWIALRAEAEFLLKVDDDVYFRPVPLLEQLRSRPPTQYAWGFFDYISPVPREEDDNFYNAEKDFPFEVFPPYPRGVVRVLSMDIVRLLAEASRSGRLKMIYGDDPCIGVHLRQLLFDPLEPLPSITLDDFDNKVFAMEPSCHPNLWSRMTSKTWAIHHVSSEQLMCMWEKDMQDGYYVQTPAGLRHDASVPWDEGLPDLCGCAPDPRFEVRTDLDDLQSVTDQILSDEESFR